MIRVVIDQKDLSRLSKSLLKVKSYFVTMDDLVQEVAEEYARAVRHNILSQNLPNYPPLTKHHEGRKRRAGTAGLHWIYTHQAYNAIGVRKGAKPDSYEVWPWDIPWAEWMEYGGGAPTPIPVFEYTLELYEPIAATKIKKWFAKIAAVYV